jgi:SAM-dependent methyltransferase
MKRKNRYGSGAVRVYRALIDPMLWPLRPRVVRMCQQLGARHVLDIACATGDQSRALARAGIRATGLDLSEDMVAIARNVGGRNVDYVQGSAYELPFDDGSMDVSLLVLALHEHTEAERTRMLHEAIRVARRFVLLADYEAPPHMRLNLAWGVIRFVEHIAGPEHRSGFLDFVHRGSLTGLLGRHQLSTAVEKDSHFHTMRIVAVPVKTDQGEQAV